VTNATSGSDPGPAIETSGLSRSYGAVEAVRALDLRI